MNEEVNKSDDISPDDDVESEQGPEGFDDDDVALSDEFEDGDSGLGDEFSDDEDSKGSDGDEDEDEDDTSTRPSARKVDDDDDDDDEEEEDVEADLDEILRGRLASEDDDEDEEEAAAAGVDGQKPGVVNARKSDEFVCGICFMVVAQKQTELPCPMGDGLESHQPLDM